MPCLIVACLEVEANVSIVRRCGKASYVRKYLDSAVAERMEITRESSEDSSRRAMERLASLVQVLPIEMWEVALLTWSSGESVRTAKI